MSARLSASFLADFAVAEADRFQSVGAGIRILRHSRFPASRDFLSLAVQLEFDPTDVGQDHELEITAIGPDGTDLVPAVRSVARPRLLTPESRIALFTVVSNMTALVFPQAGDYVFSIRVGGETIGTVPLLVVERPLARPQAARELKLTDGYNAFGEGRFEDARRIFREMTEEFPDYAESWNNLGFLQLILREPAEAEKSFQTARASGYGKEDIIEINLACCAYALGKFGDALTAFQAAFKVDSFTESSTLLGLVNDDVSAVPVHGIGNFVALASMNGAWAAVQMGDLQEASRLAALARTIGIADDGSPFADWLAASGRTLDERLT